MTKSSVLFTTLFLVCFTLSAYALESPDTIDLSGDFRYRHEYFDQEDTDSFHRHQVRMRLRLETSISDQVDFITQLASGEGNAPFSTDQTLTGSFSTKSVWLDQVYVNWKPENISGLNITAGKTPNPFYRVNNNQLMWNPEVFTEGLAAHYAAQNNSISYFATATSLWVEQRAAGDDSFLLAGQGGVKIPGDTFSATLGAGYFTYTNAKGNLPYFDAGGFGNSLDSNGNYANDFNLAELFAELGLNTGIGMIPSSIYADFVVNSGADEDNTAFLVGLTFGKCEAPGTFAFSYNYIQIEKDALIGVLNDPDFAGGATDSKGSKLGLAYQITENISTDLTLILSKMAIDNGKDYNRAQWAFNFGF